MELFPRDILPDEIVDLHDKRIAPWPAFVIGVSLQPAELTPAAHKLNEELAQIPTQLGDEIIL